ncbi:TPR repeat-containing protein [Caballeronia fortuita]|uniref:TPR repeat-containing protein n=2 Tax=Caballeronia fortuita TaxID=1777138 RepID=A0A158BRE2_9BURK|nr:TPR repeat-containing protein [Caballeronia fortuita]
MSSNFSVERFEACVHGGKPDEAIAQLCEFGELLQESPFVDLTTLLPPSDAWPRPNRNRLLERFFSRMAAGIVSLLGDTEFTLTDAQFQQLAGTRSLIQHLLGAAPLKNADHVTRRFLPVIEEDGTVRLPVPDAIKRLNILCNSESQLPLDFNACMRADPAPALNLAIAIAGEILPGSADAHRNREALLDWLCPALADQHDVRDIEIKRLLFLYMHCTYAEVEHRHEIKRSINQLVRRTLAKTALTDLNVKLPAWRAARERPLMLVVLEAFTDGHSIARTHGPTLAAARTRFDVVAMCYADAIGDYGRSIFTQVIELPADGDFMRTLMTIRQFAESEHPDVLYMPSVGMSLLTLCVSNMRLAPLQIAGLGHPATTHSDCIDYVSVEEDFVGDPACFSEALLRLPRDGQPYRPSPFMEPVRARRKKTPGHIDIGVAASLMKLSPSFLNACREISARSRTPVHFHFLTSGGNAVTLLHLAKVAQQAWGAENGTVMPGQSYMDYVNYLNDMDMFLSPFPFGNTNGIVDAFTVGLPGVCKTGREVFERIDGAMFMRAYMPGWLVADTVDEYVESAVRLANNHDERESLRRYMLEKNVVTRFFEGRPEVFGEMVLDLVERERLKTA